MVQADLMSTGTLAQSRGAAAMKDRSPMVTFLKRFWGARNNYRVITL